MYGSDLASLADTVASLDTKQKVKQKKSEKRSWVVNGSFPWRGPATLPILFINFSNMYIKAIMQYLYWNKKV